MIYLDYAANSPVDEEVLDVFTEYTRKYYANPNASHKLGIEAKEIIDNASKNIAKNLDVLEEEIIYTSGASESNNLAVKGICHKYKNYGKHIIASELEHNSIIAPLQVLQEEGFEVDLVGVTKEGLIDIEELKSLIRDDTILVSITSVDSEIGLKQPIEEIGKLLKEYPNVHFHTDASQAMGKFKMDLTNVDLMTFTPHKFYGINGFGCLIKKKDILLTPIINGGKSTTVYRSGTPVLPQIVALDKALDKALKNMDERNNYIKKLSDKVKEEFKKYDRVIVNNTEKSVPHTINISIKGVKSLDFAKKLEEHEVYISTKTSCCPDKTPSKMVYALTKDKNLATSSLRISISHLTKEEEIDKFLDIFKECYEEI